MNTERLLERFFTYVKIDSETCDEKEMADKLVEELQEMGFNAIQEENGKDCGSTGNNVYCYIEGEKGEEPILFSSHMDTVVPGKGIEPYVEDGYVRSKGETILGGDDKSGIVAVVEGLKILQESKRKHRPIEILFTVREESGLLGSKSANYERIKSKEAVVLDSSGDVGVIITNAPGQTKIQSTIYGVTAHAGVAPEAGVSAIRIGAEAISKMKLLRIDEETTANIGTFSSINPTNIVPGSATFIAEARSRDLNKLKEQTAHMVKCLEDACKQYGTKLDCTVETAYGCFSVPNEAKLVQLVWEKCEKIGVKPQILQSGGGSDGNIFNEKGIQTIILGTGMDKVHTNKEQISVKNLEDITKLAVEIMALS